MLLKLLSPQDKSEFLNIAELLTLCDNPLLWDGKKFEDITPQSNLDNVAIQKVQKEIELIAELKLEGGDLKREDYPNFKREDFHSILSTHALLGAAFAGLKPESSAIEKELLKILKTYPLQKIEEPTTRLGAALAVLKELLNGKKSEFPSVPKLMLFELMQVALVDGNISSIEWQLLKEFAQHYKLEEYIFDELLERAEVTSREIKKTITIIFE